MIPSKKNARRPWEPEEEKQLREMAEAGKTITIIAPANRFLIRERLKLTAAECRQIAERKMGRAIGDRRPGEWK